MASELRNLAGYTKHTVKALLRGDLAEARAAGLATVLRTFEALRDPWTSPRVTCAFCGWRGRAFRTLAAGHGFRRGAVCPRCLSLERHRDFIGLFQALRSQMPSSLRVLDVAPTRAFSEYCRRDRSIEYLSIDKSSPLAMRHMDMQHLELESEQFDVVVCYHVLDYVPDDVGALRELRRVLKGAGVAMLQEGLAEDRLTEEWRHPRPEQQYRIRQYGRDFPERLKSAGLQWQATRRPSGLVFLVAKSAGVLSRLADSIAAHEAAAEGPRWP